MNIFVPGYYRKFKCIADKCRHNCCVGWEIDIDSDTAEYYKSIPAPFGEKIRNNVDFDCECPHFILKAGDRCPFLQSDGLCEIIKDLGEDALCDICSDHPRFRNFYSNCEELGIGLCCEEAGRVVLTFQEKFSLVPIDDRFEPEFDFEEFEMLEKRDHLFSLACNREKDIFERITDIAQEYDFCANDLFPFGLKELFLSLERLDESWTHLLESVEKREEAPKILYDKDFSVAFEQLLCYFIFRHFADSLDDGNQCGRVKFSISAVLLIAHLCDLHCEKNGKIDIDDIAEISRMFSSEIEYSQENLDTCFVDL